MVEVLWVAIFGMALAWLQSTSAADEPLDEPVVVEPPDEDRWARWEEEIHDWRER